MKNYAQIIRTFIYVFTMLNTILTATGHNPLPISDSEIYIYATLALTVAVFAYGVWKNYPTSEAGRVADKVLHAVKSGAAQAQDVLNLLEYGATGGYEMEKRTMNFGEAIEALKSGKKVARAGWNGKGMFIYLVGGSIVPFCNLRGNAAKFVNADVTNTDDACINAHIDMKAADGTIVVGWLASQTDMLAEDWEVLQ